MPYCCLKATIIERGTAAPPTTTRSSEDRSRSVSWPSASTPFQTVGTAAEKLGFSAAMKAASGWGWRNGPGWRMSDPIAQQM